MGVWRSGRKRLGTLSGVGSTHRLTAAIGGDEGRVRALLRVASSGSGAPAGLSFQRVERCPSAFQSSQDRYATGRIPGDRNRDLKRPTMAAEPAAHRCRVSARLLWRQRLVPASRHGAVVPPPIGQPAASALAVVRFHAAAKNLPWVPHAVVRGTASHLGALAAIPLAIAFSSDRSSVADAGGP